MSLIQFFHQFTTTVPPTTTHTESPEALLHEPWGVLVALLITSLAGILGGVAAVIGAMHAKQARAHASTIAGNVKADFDAAVGIPNGHGSLMAQTAAMLQNQHDIQQTQARESQSLNARINFQDAQLEKIHGRVSKVDDKLDDHVSESQTYRASIRHTLAAVKENLDDHVKWEMTQKYPHSPADFQWDGTERRKAVAPHLPERRANDPGVLPEDEGTVSA